MNIWFPFGGGNALRPQGGADDGQTPAMHGFQDLTTEAAPDAHRADEALRVEVRAHVVHRYR